MKMNVITLRDKKIILISVIGIFILISLFYYLNSIQEKKQVKLQTPQTTLPTAVIPTNKPAQPNSPFSKLPPEILNSKIYFQKETSVHELTPLNGSSKVFLDADTYKFSPDFTKAAYIRDYGLKGDFFIFDLKNNQTKAYKAETQTQRGLEWSPDGKYILLNVGTSPDGVTFIFDVDSGKKIGDFAQRGKLIWKDNETFFLQGNEKVNSTRPWGGGDASSIDLRNVRTNEVQTILKADENTDYQSLFYKDNCLYFIKIHVDTPSDWFDQSKQKETYYCYNTQNGEQITATAEQVKEPDDGLSKSLAKLFNIDLTKGKFISIIKNDRFQDWIIAVPYAGGSVYETDFYILNIRNPKETLTKLGRGASITWVK